MLNYIKSDLYRIFHRPYMYVLFGVLIFLALFYDLMFYNSVPREVPYYAILQYGALALPMFLSVMLVDVAFAEENKYGTMKNTIAYGSSRTVLFISKTITAVILGIACAALMLCAFFLGTLFLKPGKEFTSAFFSDFLLRTGACVLLCIGAVLFAMAIAVLFKKNSVYAFTVAGLMLVPTLMFKLMSATLSKVFIFFFEATLLGQGSLIGTEPARDLIVTVWVVLAHIVVFGIIGAVAFRRQEIN